MTSSATAGSPPGRPARLRALGELLPRMVRVFHGLKAGATGDRAAHLLLFPLDRHGPLRQGALADLVHADPSTVSRHVAALVEQGLVRRAPDERDGRASQLVVTDAGAAVIASLRAESEALLARVTAGWDTADLAVLTDLLGRLVDGLAATLPSEDADALRTPRETR